MYADQRTIMRNAQLVGVLERLCQGLELTDSQFELAKARYEAVGSWLAGAEEKLIRTVLIYPRAPPQSGRPSSRSGALSTTSTWSPTLSKLIN